MGTVFIKLNNCIIMIAITCTLFTCKKQISKKCLSWEEGRDIGLVLEEYKISNQKLDSITVEFVKWQKRTNKKTDKDIQLMYVLACPDSMKCVIGTDSKNNPKKYIDVLAYPHDTRFFGFCSTNKSQLALSHIFRHSNMKILGYVTCDSIDIILMSNIHDSYYFERLFKEMLHTTGNKKTF